MGGIGQAEKWIGALQIVHRVANAGFRSPGGSAGGKTRYTALRRVEEETVVRAVDENRGNQLVGAAPAVCQRQPAVVVDHDVAFQVHVIVGAAAGAGG